MTPAHIEEVTNNVRFIASLSAGIDRIQGARHHSKAGRNLITHSVTDYLRASELFSLRVGF